MGEWDELPLDTLCSLITDGKHGDCADQPNSGFFFLSVKDVVGGRLRYDGARQICERDFLETHRRTNLEPGDVLFTNTGTIGRMAIAPDDPKTFRTTFQKSVAILKPKRNIISSQFLYYALRFANSGLSGFAAGTTQVNLLLKDIKRFRIKIPDLAEQNRVVGVLGLLDEKAELNRRTNETLEALARAIFNDWFVDFGPTKAKLDGLKPYLSPEIWSLFPGKMDDADKPEGWQTLPLDEMADFLNGLALQKFPGTGDGDLPVIKIAELRAGVTTNSGKASCTIPQQFVVEDGDVLFSWSGSLTQKVWTGGRGALNQHLFKVTSQKFPKWLHYLWVEHHLPAFQAIAASKATTMGHIQRHHLSEAKTVVGDRKLMGAADRIIAPLFERVVLNEFESRTLAQTRDLLLPKLMSGEIRVKEAEKRVAELV